LRGFCRLHRHSHAERFAGNSRSIPAGLEQVVAKALEKIATFDINTLRIFVPM